MPRYQTICFTGLELKALWLRATGNGELPASMRDDQVLVDAGERAIDKVFRAEKGMVKRSTSPKKPKRGAPISCGRRVQTSAQAPD